MFPFGSALLFGLGITVLELNQTLLKSIISHTRHIEPVYCCKIWLATVISLFNFYIFFGLIVANFYE